MADDRWIVVRNWDEFQHYTDRDPLWIKVYTSLVHNDDFLSLTDAAKGVLLTIWLEFASAHGQLRVRNLPVRMRPVDVALTLESLNHAGFIDLVASKPSRARSREKEKILREERAEQTRSKSKAVDNPRSNADAYRQHEANEPGRIDDELNLEMARLLAGQPPP